MTIKKRLAAMGTAIMMMASMAAISADAASQSYNLNASSKSASLYFSTTQSGKYTASLTVNSIASGTTVSCVGYVYINNGWTVVVSDLSKSNTGTASKTGSSNKITAGLDARNTLTISSGSASGSTNGY